MGLKIGFQAEEVKHMSLPMLNAFVRAYNEINDTTNDDTRMATQDDIDGIA